MSDIEHCAVTGAAHRWYRDGISGNWTCANCQLDGGDGNRDLVPTAAYRGASAAAALYREALGKARDCCGCGEGSTEECAADLLTEGPTTWRDDIVERARALLHERYGIVA